MPGAGASSKWSWCQAVLAVLLILDLGVLTYYLWGIPEGLGPLDKTLATVGGWLTSLLGFLGVKIGFRKKKYSLGDLVASPPVQLGIVVFTVLAWAFALPFHSLTVTVRASGTEVFLDGVTASVDGETPRGPASDKHGFLKIGSLLASSHTVEFNREGYKTEPRGFKFEDVISFGTPIPIYLRQAKGSVNVSTEPSGADIFVDASSTPVGSTPKEFQLATGKYRLTMRKSDYGDLAEDIVVTERGVVISRTLQRLPQHPVPKFPLLVSSEPEGANIYVDGVFQGVTITTVRIPRGDHKIDVRMDGYITGSNIVTTPQSPMVAFDLKKRFASTEEPKR